MEERPEVIEAVIFDLDDTLVPERQYIESGYRSISKILSGITGVDSESIFVMLMKLWSESPKYVFNRLFDNLKVPYTKSDIMELVEAYRNHIPDIHFYDDVLPFLKRLKEKDIKTGIITDGYISSQRNKLKVLKADKYFDQIIITEELGRDYWKPHPRAFELMKFLLKTEFNKMIYVGDNPAKDFYIGSVFPIKTVRICRDDSLYKNNTYLKNIHETKRISSLISLIEVLSIR